MNHPSFFTSKRNEICSGKNICGKKGGRRKTRKKSGGSKIKMKDNNYVERRRRRKELTDMLDTALSSHSFMKEQLSKTEWELAESVDPLYSKYYQLYEDWRDDFREEYKDSIRTFLNNFQILIKEVGFSEARKSGYLLTTGRQPGKPSTRLRFRRGGTEEKPVVFRCFLVCLLDLRVAFLA